METHIEHAWGCNKSKYYWIKRAKKFFLLIEIEIFKHSSRYGLFFFFIAEGSLRYCMLIFLWFRSACKLSNKITLQQTNECKIIAKKFFDSSKMEINWQIAVGDSTSLNSVGVFLNHNRIEYTVIFLLTSAIENWTIYLPFLHIFVEYLM